MHGVEEDVAVGERQPVTAVAMPIAVYTANK
jgi:hypothetical protein